MPKQDAVGRFRGGLLFEAHRLVYHSTIGWRVIKKKKVGGNPQMRVEMPNGRMPPDCVYFCWIPAICLVQVSGFRTQGFSDSG